MSPLASLRRPARPLSQSILPAVESALTCSKVRGVDYSFSSPVQNAVELPAFSVNAPRNLAITPPFVRVTQKVEAGDFVAPAVCEISTVPDVACESLKSVAPLHVEHYCVTLISSEVEASNASTELHKPVANEQEVHPSIPRCFSSQLLPPEIETFVPVDIRFRNVEVSSLLTELEAPRCRGRVFVKFLPRRLSEAADNARAEASRQRPPDSDPFSSLFLLLLPPKNWDLRVNGLQHFLRAFPEGKVPFPFQQHGLRFLINSQHCLLADEMGLGKTVQAILALRAMVHSGQIRDAVVVCPRTLLQTWYAEITEWAPELSVGVAYGSNRHDIIKKPYHVYLTNYESVKGFFNSGRFRSFDLLIVDEIQNLKNPSTLRSQFIGKIKALRRWGLSGTPVENKLDDYRAIWRILDTEITQSRPSDDEIVRTTKASVLRRTKSEVLKELPNQILQVVPIDLEGKQRLAYDAQEATIQREITGLIDSGARLSQTHIFEQISRLKQLCVVDPVSNESAKMDWIHEHLDEMHPVWPADETCEKALIFTQYSNLVWEKWELQKRLKDFHPLRLDGSLSDRERVQFVRRFQDTERHRVAFVGLKVGGTGLTLTRANHVIFLDEWWNPAVMAQAAARIHRIGQRRTCYVISLVARDTIDERIQRILAAKKELAAAILSDIQAGRRKPGAIPDLKSALSIDDMLRALGLSSAAERLRQRQPLSR